MNALLPFKERMRITGYVAITDHGFALPAYRDVADRGNAWYFAEPEIDGDHQCEIAGFDVLEEDITSTISDATDVGVGSPWRDVFLWKQRAFVGTPSQIFGALADAHDDLCHSAPLSYLDLALAAGSTSTIDLSRISRRFLQTRLGPLDGDLNFGELIVRSGVELELRRHLYRNVPEFAKHQSILEFRLHRIGEIGYLVELSPGSSSILGSPLHLSNLKSALARFGERIGVEVAIQDFDELPSVEALEALSPPPPPAAEPKGGYLGGSKRRRTRLLGLAREIAIDLGSSHTRIYAGGKRALLTESSAVAVRISRGRRQLISVGDEAMAMVGKTPDDIEVVCPLRDGAIVDLDLTVAMLKQFIGRVHRRNFGRPLDVVICAAQSSTSFERRVMRDALKKSGASQILFIEGPIAAAAGAGLPVTEPFGSIIAIIGSGMTEIATVTLGRIAYGTSYRAGGEIIVDAIANYVRRHHNLLIGTNTAERIKRDFADVHPTEVLNHSFQVAGRDLINGVPSMKTLKTSDLARALKEPMETLLECFRIHLENMAPELVADVVDTGITLAGGGALLKNLDRFLEYHIGLPVKIAVDPIQCIARGLSRVLEDEDFRKLLQPI